VAKDGSVVHGRTLDWALELDAALVVVPRAAVFSGTTHLGEGLRYISKYGAVGLIAHNQPAILDGINEKGLSAAAFSFNGYARYTPVDAQNVSLALSPTECVHWILTQHATVDEVREALSHVVIGKTPDAPAFHYIVYDRSGKSMVIKPL
jgi:choloylglycine hydrolase